MKNIIRQNHGEKLNFEVQFFTPSLDSRIANTDIREVNAFIYKCENEFNPMSRKGSTAKINPMGVTRFSNTAPIHLRYMGSAPLPCGKYNLDITAKIFNRTIRQVIPVCEILSGVGADAAAGSTEKRIIKIPIMLNTMEDMSQQDRPGIATQIFFR